MNPDSIPAVLEARRHADLRAALGKTQNLADLAREVRRQQREDARR